MNLKYDGVEIKKKKRPLKAKEKNTESIRSFEDACKESITSKQTSGEGTESE